MLTPINTLWLFLTVIATGIQLWLEGKDKAAQSKHAQFGRLAMILLFLGTLTSFYREDLERTRDLTKLICQIQRSLNVIQEVSVSFIALVPAKHMDIITYRSYLLANEDSCLGPTGGATPRPIEGKCLPKPGTVAYRHLGTVHLFLNFCVPKDKTSLICDEETVDLALATSAHLKGESLRLKYDAARDAFILEGLALQPYDFTAVDDIVSITDLDGTDLFISFRSENNESTEALQFEVVHLELKGAHTWRERIQRDSTKQVETAPHPRYRYRIELDDSLASCKVSGT